MKGGISPRAAVRLLLGTRGVPAMDLEGDVLLGRSWRARALAGWLGAAPYATIVAPSGTGGASPALAQARRRIGGGAADLVRLVPSVDAAGEGAWQALLDDVCRRLGERGALRVYAAVPTGDEAALQALLRSGFTAFAADVVFRRELEATRPADTPALDEVGNRAAARLVEAGRGARERIVEGPEGDWSAYPVGGHWPGRVAAGVVAGVDGEARAAWRVVDGVAGSWLRAEAPDDAGCSGAVAAGLAAAGRSPIWAAARVRQPALQHALATHGFQVVAERRLLVRHTARFAPSPAWREPGAAAIAPSPPVTPARSRPTGP